jgi:Flp pilus assembly pilin Flp
VDRLYTWQGRAHAGLAHAAQDGRGALVRARRDERGQGTVEYVGLILLVAVILAGVVKASGGLKDSTIAEAVIKKLKGAIDTVGEGK